MTRCRFAIPAVLGLLGVTCKDSTAPVVRHAASLIVPDSAVVLEADSIQLRARLTDSAGDAIPNPTVLWLSGDTSIATVSASGMVHFRHLGRTMVGALSEGLAGHTMVTAAVQIQQLDLGSVYGFNAGCAITTKGSLYCLDVGHQDSLRLVPTSIGPLSQVAVGTTQTCVLTVAGAAYCMGQNQWGQLGYDTTQVGYPTVDTPVPVKGGHTYESISSGVSHTCGMTSNGQVFCWGLNSSGQLGNGDTTVTASTTPLLVAGGLNFSSVTTGDFHSCGIADAALTAYCWGSNSHMALGSADSAIRVSFVPVAVSGATGVSQIVAGDNYGCTLAPPGAPVCWGDGQFGQLGVDTANLTSCPTIPTGFVCSDSPQPVAGGVAFQYVVAHAGLGNGLDGLTCGLTPSGAAYCWGRNDLGEVGDGSTVQRNTPVAVAGSLTFTKLVAGDFHACGFTGTGTVYCWGYAMGPHPARIPGQP